MFYPLRTCLKHPGLVLFAFLVAITFFVAEGEASTSEGIRQAYYPADFAQFAPRSALDLVKQIPGFSIDEGKGDRGLWSS